MIKRTLFVIFLLIPGLVYAQDQTPTIPTSVEKKLDDLDVRLGILEEKSKLMAGRTQVSYLDAWFLRTGLDLIFPRASTFNYRTDTGLGIFVGIGKYMGRKFSVDTAFDWNLYPAVSFRIRYEWHNQRQTLNLGPLIGVKFRVADRRPLDNFMSPDEDLKGTLFKLGVGAGFPLGLSIVQSELFAEFNQQLYIVASLGLHFFL